MSSTDIKTLLYKAIQNNDLLTVQSLVKEGIDVNSFTDRDTGYSPLVAAIETKNTPMVQLLLESNAIVNSYYDADTYLQLAIETGVVRMVELMLEAGADPNKTSIFTEETPLFWAVKKQSTKMVQLLCQANANPFLKDKKGQKVTDLEMSKKMREALQDCLSVQTKDFTSARQILTMIKQSIESKHTFTIQSQKTGTCYSDSFQHVLYFADGIGPLFIQRAIERSKTIKTIGDLPLSQKNITEQIKTPLQAANLYMDFTGVRFLDMFQKPLVVIPPSKKQLMVRRPSITSSISNQPVGILCSKTLSVFEIVRSIFLNKETLHMNEQNKRISTLENFPNTLNSEGMGFVFEEAAFDLWTTMFSSIPKQKGKARILGQTTLRNDLEFYDAKRDKYRVDPKYIVGILFVVYPEALVRITAGVGHAVSMVRTFGKWYLCDDNVGVALPVTNEFSVDELLSSTFFIRFGDKTIDYAIKIPYKIKEWFAKNPGVKEAPESAYVQILASVPLKSSLSEKTYYEPEYGYGGYMNLSISRKYITWQPTATTSQKKNNGTRKVASLNNTPALKALAIKYGILKENEE